MENAVLVGLSRQVALSRELEVVANNVANLNTTGFKSDGALFEQYMMPVGRDNTFKGGDSRLNFTQDRGTWLDLSQGPVQQTGNPLDLALEGPGYLVVDTPRGERYTRNGALQMNATGELVTSEGYRVLGEAGPITLQNTDHDITINADGSVRVREGTNATIDSSRGKLRLVEFDRPQQQLRKDGSSLFLTEAGVQPTAATVETRIAQGAVEKSNVQSILEMTRLIEVSRSYTDVAAILAQQGDMRRDTISRLADVPA
jgi:flagellar basal-body rod protein FlgF